MAYEGIAGSRGTAIYYVSPVTPWYSAPPLSSGINARYVSSETDEYPDPHADSEDRGKAV